MEPIYRNKTRSVTWLLLLWLSVSRGVQQGLVMTWWITRGIKLFIHTQASTAALLGLQLNLILIKVFSVVFHNRFQELHRSYKNVDNQNVHTFQVCIKSISELACYLFDLQWHLLWHPCIQYHIISREHLHKRALDMCKGTVAKQTKRHYISPVPTQGFHNSTSATFVSFAPR